MVGLLKSSFFKTEIAFDTTYKNYLEMMLLEGEIIEESLPIYKSGEVFAWFTNKRIIFTSSPVNIGAFGHTTEFEFLPYSSIQRYMLLDGNTINSFKVEIFLIDRINISFFMSSMGEAADVLKFIAKKCK